MAEPRQAGTRSWARDVAILLVAAVVGAAVFFLVAGRDGGGYGEVVDPALGAGGSEPATTGEADDVARDVEAGAGSDIEPVDPEEATDAETAVASFLAAEVRRDFAASFAMLTTNVQQRVGDSPQRWRAEHRELPVVTGFEIVEVAPDGEPQVRTVLALDSTLDPVVGLVPARAEAVWVVEETAEGFRVNFDASTLRPLYPDEGPARDVALEWARRLQTGGDVSELEGVERLYGPSRLRAAVAESTGQFDAGAPLALPPDGGSRDLVAAFGADVVGWGRAVPLGGATTQVTVVLAPIDDEWRVIGLFEPR